VSVSRSGLVNLRRYRRDPLAFFRSAAAATPEWTTLRMGPFRMILLTRPEHVHHVLVGNAANYTKQTPGFKKLRLVLGNGLVTSEGALWRRQRRIAQPAFHHQRLARIGGIATEITRAATAMWTTGQGGLDFYAWISEVTMAVVSRAMLSVGVDDDAAVLHHAVQTVVDYASAAITNPLLLPWLPIGRTRRFRRELARLDDFLRGLIATRRAAAGRGDDLLAMWLETTDDGEAMDDTQLRDELITMFVAGHETTAAAVTWTFHLLAHHPEIAARLHAELDRVLGDRAPALADLEALPYLRAVIDEVLRLYPPVWAIARRVVADDEIEGHRARAGSLVAVSPFVLGRDPAIWDEPDAFRPERFVSGGAGPIDRRAYFPFGLGARKCIGEAFALLETRLIVATIAQQFRVDADPDHPLAVPAPGFTLRPRAGFWVRPVARRVT
jgi:cytochrome P450